ncbi:MAG: 4-hydroxy-tetrahydrodipicolinate synthase [Candidatus Pacebacteria bacterium]|nr:4-hydroxy-tetrahydrodipicolinate synthase [Candidatus Paceibacterota bacterium]
MTRPARHREVTPLQGSMTALITPFKNGKLDEAAFQKLCQWQIDQGTDALVPVGTTGESPTLSHDEHCRVVELCIEVAAGKVPVIAGAGSNSTAEAIDFAERAEQAGADYILTVSPYYNKPTQEGLYLHFKAIHDSVQIPLILYNIPGRSIVDINGETMARLAKLPRVAGVKDATADLARPPRLRQSCGADFVQLSGEDATALAYLVQGGVGCISVSSNVAAKELADMHRFYRMGKLAEAQAINYRLTDLHEALFIESSPGPVKYAAQLLGLCGAETRLPLAPITDATKKRVEAAMAAAGIK